MTSPPFHHLLAAYRPRILRLALGWLGDEQEAREATQDTLMKAWAARSRYDPKRPFYPWLRVIAKNTCKDRNKRRGNAALPGLDAERLASQLPTPEQHALAHQSERALHRALATLSEGHRQIIVLRHFEGLSYAECAEILEVAEGTVMSRLFRARKALLEALNTQENP